MRLASAFVVATRLSSFQAPSPNNVLVMLPKPKEILPTVVGTVVVLTALLAVISPKFTSSSATDESAPKAKLCCATCEQRG